MLQQDLSRGEKLHRLPRRDLLILPLLSLFTFIVLFTSAELVTRLLWPEQIDDPCFAEDPVSGFHFEKNCISRTKNAEGDWVTNHFNECGYRSNTSCLSKPTGSLRMVVLGSSISQGLFVPYEQTFFVRAARQLSRYCSQTVDVQNLGVPEASPIYVYRRVAEAIALKPDVVIYALTPFDLEQGMDAEALAQRNAPKTMAAKPHTVYKRGFFAELQRQITGSRTVLVAQHLLFSRRETFLKLYLVYGDKADFLRQPLTPAWQNRFRDMDLIIGDMADRFRAAGVRFVVMPVPSRAEAALLSSPQPPAGTDAFAFDRMLSTIAAKHRAEHIDLVDRFAQVPDSENLFFVVDGHLRSQGQALVADAIVRRLLAGDVPAFSHCSAAEVKSPFHS